MAIQSKAVWAVVAAASLSVLLSGCGHDSAAPTTATTTSTSSTTTTTMHPRTAPMSPLEAAKYLNELYTGYNESNSSSPLGVTISMAANTTQFFGNIFCTPWDNPAGRTGCHEGQTDCRLSASLYNHKMIINKTTNATVVGFDRYFGFVINQSQVEKAWAKCSYIWDGSTGFKLNRGCARSPAVPAKCSEKRAAYYDICDSGKTCTAKDPEVTEEICAPAGGPVAVPATLKGYAQCLFPGPAIDFHGQKDYTPGETQNLRKMVQERIARNDGKDEDGSNLEKWNEIVVDELIFLPDMWYDPALAIPAIIYPKSKGARGKEIAQQMSAQISSQVQVGRIPVVMLDDEKHQPDGPFFAVGEDIVNDVTIV